MSIEGDVSFLLMRIEDLKQEITTLEERIYALECRIKDKTNE